MLRTLSIILALTWTLVGCRAPCVPTTRQIFYEQYENDPFVDESATGVLPPEGEPVAVVQPNESDLPDAETLDAPPPEPIPVSSSMTLEQLERMALSANPSLSAAVANVQALQGKWLQSGLKPNPTFGYMGNEIGDGGSAGLQGGYVGQQFITGGKLELNRAVVSQEIMRAEQELSAQRQRVLTDVRTAFYGVLIAQRKVELANKLVDVSKQAVDASQVLLKALEIPRAGLLQTQVQSQNAKILLRRSENESIAAWRRLTAVIGQPNLPQQPLDGDLEQASNDLDWDEQLARIKSQSPEIAAAVAEVERANWALDRAHAQVVPDVRMQVAVHHNDLNGDTVTGVQLAMPLPLWNRNQGGIQQAFAEIAAAHENVQRLELSLRERLAAAYQQYATARFQVDNYAKEIIPTAKETLDLVSSGYRLGEVGYLDLLTAQRTYAQTNLSYIDALRDLWQAKLLIEGLLLDDSLNSRN